MTWEELDTLFRQELKARSYARSTQATYLHVWRHFRGHVVGRLDEITSTTVVHYLSDLVVTRRTAHFIALAITVLRFALDRVGGMGVTFGLRTPRRPSTVPEILSRAEVFRMLQAADTMRDWLLLCLMYGCGLTVSETCGLRWSQVNEDGAAIAITRSRILHVPALVRLALADARSSAEPRDHVFPGGRPQRALTTRMAASIVSKAARNAGIAKPVTSAVLRHSYAVHALEDGMTLRELQVALGHRNITTTATYSAHLRPACPFSPLDRMPGRDSLSHSLNRKLTRRALQSGRRNGFHRPGTRPKPIAQAAISA